jgi:hypothetical protein
MGKELILNELSVREAPSLYSAREQMARLIATLSAATRAGASRSLRTHALIDSLLIAKDYSIAHWRNDPAVEREQRSFLRTMLSKSPFLRAEDGEALERSTRSDVFFEGRAAIGLRAALLLEALPVSLQSEPCWKESRLSVTCLSLDEDTEIWEEVEQVRHASQAEHVDEHVDWLAGPLVPIHGGHDLWLRRGELFPALVFCASVEQQLVEIASGHPLIRQIYRCLSELDRYFRSSGNTFDPSQIPMQITPESSATLEKYEAEHSFICPDGIRRVFSWHGRLTPGAWRIFFLPEPELRRATIGYIGKKLPNIKYPTP